MSMTDPIADFLVRRVRRGLRRFLGVAPIRQAHPLTVLELGRIVEAIDTDDAKDLRDRAILLIGYVSAMRPGEISALNVEDLQRKPTGVLIVIRRSKTDPDAQGHLIGVARGDNRLTDPIRALDAWLEVRPSEPGALFTSRATHSARRWRPPPAATSVCDMAQMATSRVAHFQLQ